MNPRINRSVAHFPTSNQAPIVGNSHQTGKLHKIVTLAVALIGLSAIILGSISIYASHINDTSLNVIKISDMTGGVTLVALGSLMMVYFFHRIFQKRNFSHKEPNQNYTERPSKRPTKNSYLPPSTVPSTPASISTRTSNIANLDFQPSRRIPTHSPTLARPLMSSSNINKNFSHTSIQSTPALTPTIPQPHIHTLTPIAVTPAKTPVFDSISTVPKEITNKLYSWESPDLTAADRDGALYVSLNPQNSSSTSGESDQNLYIRAHAAPSIESLGLESNGTFKIGFNTNQYVANRSQFLAECSKSPNYTLGELGDYCIVRIQSMSELTWILNLLDQENCLPNIPDNIRTAFNNLLFPNPLKLESNPTLVTPDQLKERFARAGFDLMNIPDELGFCDPISCEIMCDPVTIVLDPTETNTAGELATFDRQSYIDHIAQKKVKECPFTRRKVSSCTDNLTLKQAMINFVAVFTKKSLPEYFEARTKIEAQNQTTSSSTTPSPTLQHKMIEFINDKTTAARRNI